LYLNRIHTATFLPFIAYNTDNQLITDTEIESMKRSMKLVIDVSKKGVLDKLNAFLESFQQLQLGEYENGTITYDEEKEDEINTLLKKCFLAD